MKVILISNIKNLGNIGDVVVVKDGYARNFLIPNELAIFYSKENYKVFEEQKQKIEAKNEEQRNEAIKVQEKLKAKDIIVLENAGDDGRLYGSVSSVRLASLINDLVGSKTIKKSNVVIPSPIKSIGMHKITVELTPEIILEKDVIVARTNDEAKKIKSGEWEEEQKKKREENSRRSRVSETTEEKEEVVEEKKEKKSKKKEEVKEEKTE